ncbi:MAG: EamA family transporter [Lachnospiraceae bacterium]|nr:EamA family transporter [Lachnospiraceae bacterium]
MTGLSTIDIVIIIAILLTETFLSSLASYFLKKSSPADGGNKLKILLSPFFYLGGVLYVIAAASNIYLLQKLPYAIVLPLGSITYIWTMFLSNRLLGEKITFRKILGMCIIIVGVVLVALGKN